MSSPACGAGDGAAEDACRAAVTTALTWPCVRALRLGAVVLGEGPAQDAERPCLRPCASSSVRPTAASSGSV